MALAVLPKFTEAKLSKKGFLNSQDLLKMGRNALVFLTPTLLLYLGQLSGVLSEGVTLTLIDLIPSAFVIGAFEAYIISTAIDYLKKLNDGSQS